MLGRCESGAISPELSCDISPSLQNHPVTFHHLTRIILQHLTIPPGLSFHHQDEDQVYENDEDPGIISLSELLSPGLPFDADDEDDE